MLEIREGDAVTIKQIEVSIVNRAWDEGWIVPQPPAARTGRTRRGDRRRARRAWPPRSSCAARAHGDGLRARRGRRRARPLRRAGLQDREVGRRAAACEQLVDEGVEFGYGVDVGVDVDADELRAPHDAVVIATGSRVPRDLPVPGRELDGVHFAMEYLYDRARVLERRPAGGARSAPRASTWSWSAAATPAPTASAHSHREGAASVTQIELLGEPPAHAPGRPHAVAALAREAAHLVRAEGGRRARLRDLHHAADRQRRVERGPLGAERGQAAVRADRRAPRRSHPAELVLLAMGFLGPEQNCSISSGSPPRWSPAGRSRGRGPPASTNHSSVPPSATSITRVRRRC